MIDTQKIAKSAEHLQAKISVFDTKATLNGEDIGHLHTVLFALRELCEIADIAAELRRLVKLAKKVGPEPDTCG